MGFIITLKDIIFQLPKMMKFSKEYNFYNTFNFIIFIFELSELFKKEIFLVSISLFIKILFSYFYIIYLDINFLFIIKKVTKNENL